MSQDKADRRQTITIPEHLVNTPATVSNVISKEHTRAVMHDQVQLATSLRCANTAQLEDRVLTEVGCWSAFIENVERFGKTNTRV